MINHEPERLTLEQQLALKGKWIALEVYTPATMPARRIAAIGDSPAACLRQLAARGVDPRQFELLLYRP